MLKYGWHTNCLTPGVEFFLNILHLTKDKGKTRYDNKLLKDEKY